MRLKPKVVILCGGRGIRIAEETISKPKPMVQVGEKPILWHIMKHYARYGFDEFILCLGYKGEIIKEYFLRYRAMSCDFTIQLGKSDAIEFHDATAEESWRVTLADTGLHTNSGGRILRIEKYLRDDEPFFLTYGDGLSDVNLDGLLRFHLSKRLAATVTGVHPLSRFGELKIHGDLVAEFSEKPQVADGWINGGFFVLNKEALNYIKGDVMFERQPLERLAGARQLAVYKHHGFWQCMDTRRDLDKLNELWESGQAPWRTWSH